MVRLIDYIDSKMSQTKGNFSEIMLYVKEEILSLLGNMSDLESENKRLTEEVSRLEGVLHKHSQLHPNNYKVQLEIMEAENARLQAELEMYKAMNQKPYVAVNVMHSSSNRWN